MCLSSIIQQRLILPLTPPPTHCPRPRPTQPSILIARDTSMHLLRELWQDSIRAYSTHRVPDITGDGQQCRQDGRCGAAAGEWEEEDAGEGAEECE